ncbi:class I tRNA ligase family protein, partial [PVC group bacterium]|nr:class I tRNA ligase family protein [PVC group bacterium]
QNLEEAALFVEKKPHRHAVGRCYRCETIVEPYISNQWFVKMEPLARAAIKVVEEGKIKFYPDRWTKVYLNWMNNIRDWCISRQIWWGHRIPVYYCKNCHVAGKGVIVSENKPQSCPECGGTEISQDPDVLDTWFSSWLWPISTLGWPDQTEDLKTFYPTQTLSTAAEIIFFWVARMVMSGLEFTGEIPFSDVYIHGTVRDDHGRKMSKSLGNTVDPLHIIKKYSADALRFSMMAICAQGQDVYISEEKFELGRNFCNKLWNATRFTFMTMPIEKDEIQQAFQMEKHELKDLADTHKWILSKLDRAVEEITKNLDAFRIGEAVQSLHELFWHHFCDWYLELIKVDRDHPRNKEVTYYVLTQILKLLHPIAPFITEEIWNKILPGTSIMNQPWPKADTCYRNPAIEEEFDLVQEVIRHIRNIRKDKGVAPSKSIRVLISTSKTSVTELIKRYEPYIVHLTKIEDLSIGENLEKPKDSVASVMKDLVIYVLMEGLIDLEKEKKRLTRQLQDLDRLIKQGSGKLENKEFLQKAPQDVIKRMRDRLTELHEQQKKVEEGLKILVT